MASKAGYTVTVHDYIRDERSVHETVAVSVKQAINNVAHRLGVHFCADRPYYEDARNAMRVMTVEGANVFVMFL